MVHANADPARLEFKRRDGERRRLAKEPRERKRPDLSPLCHADELRTRFHPWIRGQDRRSPTGDGEDRILEEELEHYRDLWWAHVAKINRLKGRDPLEAGMARARKD